jgi:hypothetical protein
LTPPLTITERELDFAIGILECGGLTPPSKGEA